MAAQHQDLADAPFKPSRILQAWSSGREAERRKMAAERETAAAMAQLRSHGRSTPRRAAAAHAAAMPGFPIVSGAVARDLPARQSRSFEAAVTDRLTGGWGVSSTSINADLEHALGTLRARSRDWTQNNDTGERFLALVADNIIGAEPPRLQVRARLNDGAETLDEVANNAIEAAWWEWCQRGACEITQQLSFADVCRTMVAAAARDGEFLARRIFSDSLPHGYALQLLDADRIDTAMSVSPAAPGAGQIRMGVEVDAIGRPLALHLTRGHPGDGAIAGGRGMSERVPMGQLLHGFVLRRPEQLRGYPWTANILRRANTLADYEQYALVAAKIGAAKMGFYTTDKDAVDAPLNLEQMRDATGELVQDVEAGMLEALPPGVGFQSFDPDYPHANFGAFVTACLRGIASGLNVAHHNLTGDMSGVNYSSARIAELTERRHWRGLQRWFLDCFVRPVFNDWLLAALAKNVIRLPSGAALPLARHDKFRAAAMFQPPSWPWVDPESDLKAQTVAMSYDLKSARQLADENGVDLDDVLIDKRRQIDRYVSLGLPVPAWLSGGGASVAPAAPPPPGAAAGDPVDMPDDDDEDEPAEPIEDTAA